MDLTRQRLVTFPQKEMRVAVLQGVEAPGEEREDCRSVISFSTLSSLQVFSSKAGFAPISWSE
jgi:hypothetical protein